MRKLTFTNSAGVSIEFYKTPYLIETLDGVETPAVLIQEQKAPYQDGTTYIDTLLDNREIVITGAIVKPKVLSDIATARAAMQSILNPKLGMGSIMFQNDSVTRYATGYVSTVTLPNKDAREPYQRFQVTITCPDPYWYGTEQTLSLSGLELSQTTTATTAFWSDTAFGDDVFMSIADTGRYSKSVDGGHTWSEGVISITSASLLQIRFGGGAFIATDSSGTDSRIVRTIDYGDTWQIIDMPGTTDAWLFIGYGNGVWLCSRLTSSNKIARSTDGGNTWSEITMPTTEEFGGFGYGNGVFVCSVKNQSYCYISTDGGLTWTSKSVLVSKAWRAIAYGNGVFIITTSSSPAVCAVSSDNGNTWTNKNLPAGSNYISYGLGAFVIMASSNLYFSYDNGTSWTAEALPVGTTWIGLDFGLSAFVALSYNNNKGFILTGKIINILSELQTPVQIQVDGPKTSIQIVNGDQSLSISKEIFLGEKILIDTKFGQRSIYYYPVSGSRQNAMQYLDVNSVFWQLQPGYNNVFFTSAATLRYRERYIGV